ncbi:Pinopsin [Varanus komodoensis]|nr:Pinopsin [Varanus komodoensis]
MRKAGLDELPVGIKIAGRNINLRYADDTTLMAESEEELKSLLMLVKEESAKVGLKLNIKKTKVMASSPLTSWQIDGEEMENMTTYAVLSFQVSGVSKGMAQTREQRVLIMVVVMVICFLLCWLPYGVVALIATFGKPGLVTPSASIIPSILAKSSTVYNPIIYIFLNKQVN